MPTTTSTHMTDTTHARRQRAHRHAQKGQGVVESSAGFIIFIILSLLMVTGTLYLYMQYSIITATREGARVAAMNENLADAATVSAGITEVRQFVQNYVQNTTGQAIAVGDVLVAPPDDADPIGQRSVGVQVSFVFNSPIPVGGLVASLTGQSNTLDEFPVSSASIMRYEE